MTSTRVIAHSPNGARLGPVPAPQELSAGFPLNDVGAMSLKYPVGAPRADLLGGPVELALEVSSDDGLTWVEPPSGRFLYLRDGRDPVKTGDAYSVGCAAYVLRLRKALVPFTGLNSEGVRLFTDSTPGAILGALWDEAAARGALSGMTRSWNATQDSAGTPWPSTLTLAYEPGKDLLAILQEFADQGLVDYRTTGRAVDMFVADHPSGMGEDRTLGALPVSLRYGRDLTEAPFRRTWEALADTAFVMGDDANHVERTSLQAITPWGRQETYVTASGVKDAGTLAVIGDASLTLTERERTEHTFGLDFGAAVSLPFRDYAPGEWVWAATDGTTPPQRMRVQQVTLTRDTQAQTGGNVVLNDRFLEADVLQARRIAAIVQGATQAGTGATPGDSGAGNDILAPAQVVGLSASSAAYVEAGGRVRAQVSLSWLPVTTNADGTATSDVDHYEVASRLVGGSVWVNIAEVDAAQWSGSPYEPGQDWEFRVRAVDTVFNRGLWSASDAVTTSADSVGPVKPSTPAATSRLGTGRVTWDGLTASGGPLDPDFSHITVHVSQVNGFTPGDVDRVDELAGAGWVVAAPLTYGATYYARLLPWDTSGNTGTPSDQVTFTVAPLVDVSNFPDDAMEDLYARTGQFLSVTTDMLEANSVTGDKVLAGSLETYHLKVTDRRPNMAPNGYMEAATGGNADGWGLVFTDATMAAEDAPAAITGGRSQRVTLTAANTGFTYGLYLPPDFLPTWPGQRMSARALVRPSVDIAPGKQLILRVHSSKPTHSPYDLFVGADATWAVVDTLTGPLTGGQTYPLEGVTTIPAEHTRMSVSVSGDGMGVAWSLDIDAVELFPGTGDENITEVSAGKIRTGVLQASERIVAGGLTGARAELNGVGFQAFDSTGEKTFEVLGSTGSVYTAGTFTTKAAGANGRVEISAVNNPYQGGQLWGSILFHSNNAGWDPAVIWAVYEDAAVDWGELNLVGPKLGTRSPAKIRLRSEDEASATMILMEADEIQTLAEVHRLGDPGKDVVTVQQNYTGASTNQGFKFASPGGKAIAMRFGSAGRNRLVGTDENGAQERLDIEGEHVIINPENADGFLEVYGASQNTDQPTVGAATQNIALIFAYDALRVKTFNGSLYAPIRASEFVVVSDSRDKSNLAPVTGALDLIRGLPVSDYDTVHGRPGRHRGIMAQDLQKVLPEAVDVDENGGLSIDLYSVVATCIAAIQELAARPAPGTTMATEPTTREPL